MPQISPMSWILMLMFWSSIILTIISSMKTKTKHSENVDKKIVFSTMTWNW